MNNKEAKQKVVKATLDIYEKTGKYPDVDLVCNTTGITDREAVQQYMDNIVFDDLRRYWIKRTHEIIASHYHLVVDFKNPSAITSWYKFIEGLSEQSVDIGNNRDNIVDILKEVVRKNGDVPTIEDVERNKHKK